MMEKIEGISFLSAKVHAKTESEWHELISQSVKSKTQSTIFSLNLHGLYLFHHDQELRNAHEESWIRIDGMPVVFIGRFFRRPLLRTHRLTWMDWKKTFFSYCDKHSLKIFYLGSKQDIMESAVMKLREYYPSLQIEARNGYFDASSEEANQSVIDEINASKADVLLVGMGMPRQEKWVHRNKNRINCNAILTCGAAMEYIGDHVKTPPRWMGQIGFEWLFRLAESPLRFWKRYFIEPWFILWLIIKHMLNSKK